jgi:uncharacterized membrane protein
MNFVLLFVELETICFHFKKKKKKKKLRKRKKEKKKKIVWFAMISLIYAIFTSIFVIFKNLVELSTLV